MVHPAKVDYTMTWDCTFIIDGKSEEITFLTDDFEDVFKEYQSMKKKHKSCVFLKHEIHRKGRIIITEEMFGVPVETVEPIIDADAHRFDRHNADIARHTLREPPQERV